MRRLLDWTSSQNSGLSPSGISVSSSARHLEAPRMTAHQSQHERSDYQSLEQADQQQQAFNPARDMEIQHLIKLLDEIKYYQASSSPLPSASGSQSQRELAEKVYQALPLFLSVFGQNSWRQTTTTTTTTITTTATTTTKQSSCPSEPAEQQSMASSFLNESSYCESSSSSRQNSPLPPNHPQHPSLDRFPELLPFAFTVARLFVSDVRQRASNKHAEDASQAIFSYLRQQQDGDSQGWNLLLSLNALAVSRNPQLIQLLCDASLPSTLVKCLYLLFDLPSTSSQNTIEGTTAPKMANDEITSSGVEALANMCSNIASKLLIKTFTQLLVKLCSHKPAIDELIRKDDFRLLIGVASSHCSQSNKPWRRVAFQTLLAISKNMRDNFFYLEQNLCLQVFVDNIQRIDSLGLANMGESVDMIKVLLEFLYNIDVNNRNNPRATLPLMEQFKNTRIVELMQELLQRIDQVLIQEDASTSEISVCESPVHSCASTTLEADKNLKSSLSSESGIKVDEYRIHGKKLIHAIATLAKMNVSLETMTQFATLKPLATSRFEMLDQFKMPKPSPCNCILNYDALALLKNEWSKRKDSHLIEAILDVTISLFNDDKFNYFIFESQQLLVYYLTSQSFTLFPYKVKQKLFKFLEFIIIETNYIPCVELSTLGTIIKSNQSSDADSILGLRTLIVCLRFASKFSDIFREIGLLETIVELLVQNMQYDELNRNPAKLEVLYLLLEASQYMLAGPNNINCTQFNESGAARHVFNCLTKPEFSYLFVPAHSSSSDDSYATGLISRTSTPPTSANSKGTIHSAHNVNLVSSEPNPPSARISIMKPSIKQLQKVAFTIIRQLILSTAGDEHLANLLGLLARNLEDLQRLESLSKRSSAGADEQPPKLQQKPQHNLDLLFLMSQEVNLKICILKSLMIVLKDSHRCRTLFRKAGGFLYLISCFNCIENSLTMNSENELDDSELSSRWHKINSRKIWRLIKNLFMTIVIAMRSELANQRAFSDEVLDKFTESIQKLGCFRNQYQQNELQKVKINSEVDKRENLSLYKAIFLSPPARDYCTIPADNIIASEACCQLFRFLYDMSIDMTDGTSELEEQFERNGSIYKLQQSRSAHETKSMSFDQGSQGYRGELQESSVFKRRSQMNSIPKRPPSLDLITRDRRASIIAFPAMILSIVDLIPYSPSQDLSSFVTIVILSLLKHQRNQQVLCEAGLISKLLESKFWSNALISKNHFLHESVQTVFETLSKQSISAKELRLFLRLENPLMCKNLDDIEVLESSDETRQKLSRTSSRDSTKTSLICKSTKDKIKADRIETLVSMMSDDRFRVEPPFVEFDMSIEGSSSIFMPSIAPINSRGLSPHSCTFLNNTLDVHINEKNGILGGVGTAERVFPPTSGFTFSAWICIERFPSRSSDPNHNIRLLTIYRGSAATGKEYSCFKIQISALDRALLVSTQEMALFENEKSDVNSDPDFNMRIWTPELLLESRWHHIAVVLSKSSSKHSSACVYIDGQNVHHQHLCYISSSIGASYNGPLGNMSMNNGTSSAAAYVNAFIGSLPQYRYQLKTYWKLGPCHLVEETLSGGFISLIYALGPHNIGNFQSHIKLADSLKSIQYFNQLDRMNSHAADFAHHRPIVQQHSVVVRNHPSSHNQQLSRVSSASVTSSQPGNHNTSSNYTVLEDRILISIDARAISLMTLSRMRRIYTRFDCRQVSRLLGSASQESSLPILLLHNTGIHLNGPSRGIGAIIIGHNQVRHFVPNPTHQSLICLGGSYILIGLIAQAQTVESFNTSMKALVFALKHNVKLQAQMDNINGYQILSVLFWKKKNLLTATILKLTFSLITECSRIHHSGKDYLNQQGTMRAVHQLGALRDLICENFDLWLQIDMIEPVLDFIHELISSNHQEQNVKLDSASSVIQSIRAKNLKYLRDLDLLPRMLRLLPQYDSQQMLKAETGLKTASLDGQLKNSGLSFDTKAIYLIRQTVFELLNRTPRQSDILYFGQFLASLLSSKTEERDSRTIGLRNILMRSLLQMMTKNKQKEINEAVQEELVRILGFDWFMLFISSRVIDPETALLGLINLMTILSNEDLYESFKLHPHSSKTSNGGWLKEPVFPTMDGKLNIQLLGINVGVFFGLSGRRKSIKQDIIDAPNFFLLKNFLANLVRYPRVYLVIFQTMMDRLTSLDTNLIETLESFDKLSLDTLCDSLVGDTHHKRRQTLSGVRFKCHELVVCLIYMLEEIMWQNDNLDCITSSGSKTSISNYPVDIIRFLMYLYNNNSEFQDYCRHSNELIDALSEIIMLPKDLNSSEKLSGNRSMTQHPATKEVLELSRLIILDKMTDIGQTNEQIEHQQLLAFGRFLDSLSECREAQGELVDMLLHQVLLMIDSTARHNSIKTISSSDNALQFQLLLTNSITIAEIITDKIWLQELYVGNLARVLTIIDHQLCLAEQIFKFNELLPKHNPPYAFIMQRVLNRTLLFGLSRPMQHMSDKMLILDLLKKIFDNRTIIILNHMHSPSSAEFFVCLSYSLLKIIEDNTVGGYSSSTSTLENNLQPASLIERHYGHPSIKSELSNTPSSSSLMLASMARKVWDAVFQSKKGILSEAFDVSLSLPAFTLDTSLDLLQLKPDILDVCERYWSALLEAEQRPKKRLQQKSSEPIPGSAATTAVNILSGRLTRVVNAASFVSRVVGATAGSMASNVNLVGEKLSQTSKGVRRENSVRSSGVVESQASSSPSASTNSQSSNTQSTSIGQVCSSTSSCAQSNMDQAEMFKHQNLAKLQVIEGARSHISIIEDYIESQITQKNHKLALHRYLCDEWVDTEYEVLLRERAIFGPDCGTSLDKWCLDMTEGPRRMRKKMIHNTRQFYDHYHYQPEQFNPSNKSLRYRPPMSYDSHQYFMKTLKMDSHLLDVEYEGVFDELNNTETSQQEAQRYSQPPSINVDTSGNSDANQSCPLDLRSTKEFVSSTESITSLGPSKLAALRTTTPLEPGSPKHSEVDPDEGDSTSFVDFSPEIEAESNSARNSENIDSLSVLRLLEKNERISHMFRCSRVQGLDTHEGLLLFGKEHFYLIDGFTLLKTREIKDIDSLPADAHDPIIPNSTPNILAHSKKTCSKFSFDSIVEVHKRRYLLQPIALEIFSSDGRNTLIVFPRSIRNKVYSRLITVSNHLTSNVQESLAGQKSNVSVEGGSGLLSNLIGDTSVTQRWVRGELSNFQYLMNLNTIAGRSYNDLMQYPIFPWVLADYTSDSLDFSKSSTFRDLSRPIGAQTSERLEQFKRRYMEWDDTETPPYHYGTFYSSAMIVASYMVRMEPFTQHFLRLQGGHFDLADRMFHSIHDSWLSASKHNMADIKELVPEFFYLPEFLKNENKYDLGIKQNGMKLNDVILPPWAKNDTREFIRLHRGALESDYVSAHLHEWIDLIFGYKQQGQAAIDAVNVFHHLFYEGNVDIYNTDIDPIKKNAVIGFINNFGQVPKQLFKKPHPARKVTPSFSGGTQTSIPALTPILPAALAATNPTLSNVSRVLTHSPQSLRLSNATYKDLRGPVGQIVYIDKNLVAVEQNKLLIPPEYCRYIAWGHADRSLRLGLYDSEKPIFVWEGSENMWPNEILCCTIPNSWTMITAGTESLITVWKIEKMRSFVPVSSLYGHVEPVTCLASSQAYSLIVSGSRDRTAIIWDLNRLTFVRQLGRFSSDGFVHHGPISAIAINDSTGDIVTCASSWLYLWTINGELLAHIDSLNVIIQQSMCGTSSLSSNLGQLHLLSVCFSQHHEWDEDEVIITGASDGSISFWSLRYYQSPMSESEIAAAAAEAAAADLEQEKKVDSPSLQHQISGDDEPPPACADSTDEKLGDTPAQELLSNQSNRTSSEPINITGTQRQRTDTMNSEWVRLSASSTSTTAELLPMLKATPSSIGEDHQQPLMSSTSPPSSDKFDDSFLQTPLSSTPVASNAFADNLAQIGDTPNQPSEDSKILALPSKAIVNDPSLIKFSKSDTSLVESFVILGNDGVGGGRPNGAGMPQLSPAAAATQDRIRPQSSTGSRPSLASPHRARRRLLSSSRERFTSGRNSSRLQPNHCWRRELYLRHILNRRVGKSIPGAVTSLAISKDHRTLFVGDINGYISSWSVG